MGHHRNKENVQKLLTKNSIVLKEWIQVAVLFLLHQISNDPSIALCDT